MSPRVVLAGVILVGLLLLPAVRSLDAEEASETDAHARAKALVQRLADAGWPESHRLARAIVEIGPEARVVFKDLEHLIRTTASGRGLTSAVYALDELGHEPGHALLTRLTDDDPKIRSAVLDALSELGEPTALLLAKRLPAASAHTRYALLTGLGWMGRKAGAAAPSVAALATSKDPAIRRFVGWTLGRISAPGAGAASALVALASDADEHVRATTMTALALSSAPGAESVILRGTSDDSAVVRWRAAEALGVLDAEVAGAEEALRGLLHDPSSAARWAAIEALGRRGSSRSNLMDTLRDGLAADDPRVRWAAAGALATCGEPRSASEALVTGLVREKPGPVWHRLLESVQRRGDVARVALTNAFARAGRTPPQALLFTLAIAGKRGGGADDTLATLLAEGDEMPRALAAVILATDTLGAKERGVLQRALDDASPLVRRAAAWGLGYAGEGQDEIVARLVPLLGDQDSGVRWSAAESLGRLGRSTEDVVAGLSAVLEDDDAWVRSRALWALVRLTSPRQLMDLLAQHERADWVFDPSFVGPIPEVRIGARRVRRDEIRELVALGRRSATEDVRLVPVGLGLRELVPYLSHEDWEVVVLALQDIGSHARAALPVAPQVMALLASDDEDVVAAAGRSLRAMGGEVLPRLRAELVDATRDRVHAHRAAIVRVMGTFGGEAAPYVAELLQAADGSEIRASVLDALGRIGVASDAVRTVVVAALMDEVDSITPSALDAAARLGFGGPDVMTRVRGLLQSARREDVALAAAKALLSLAGPAEAAVAILDALDREDPILYYEDAADVLVRAGPATRSALVAGLGREHYPAREAVYAAMRMIGSADEATVGRLLSMRLRPNHSEDEKHDLEITLERVGRGLSGRLAAMYVSERPEERRLAQALLMRIGGDPELVGPALVRRLEEVSARGLLRALTLMARIGPGTTDAIVPLRRILREQRLPELRRLAVESLGLLATPEVLPPLVDALGDDDAPTREAALRAITGWPRADETELDAWTPLLRGAHPEQRRVAAWRIGQLWPVPPGAAEAVAQLLTDEDPQVRADAARALRRLRPLPAGVIDRLRPLQQDEDEDVRELAEDALGVEAEGALACDLRTRVHDELLTWLDDREHPPLFLRCPGIEEQPFLPGYVPTILFLERGFGIPPSLLRQGIQHDPGLLRRLREDLGRRSYAPRRFALSPGNRISTLQHHHQQLIEDLRSVPGKAVRAFAYLPAHVAPVADALIERFDDPSPAIRRMAAVALARAGESARPALIDASADDRVYVRAGAYLALSARDPGPPPANVIARGLADRHPLVRRYAALAALRHGQQTPEVARLLIDGRWEDAGYPVPGLYPEFSEALSESAEAGAEELARLLEGGSAWETTWALGAVGAPVPGVLLDPITALLAAPEPISWQASRALARDEAEGIPRLVAALSRSDARRAVLENLNGLLVFPPELEAKLQVLALSAEEDTAQAAKYWLRRMKEDGGIDDLIRRITDPKQTCHADWDALAAMGRDARPACSAVRRVLRKSSRSWELSGAAKVAGAIGPEAWPVVPRLLEILPTLRQPWDVEPVERALRRIRTR